MGILEGRMVLVRNGYPKLRGASADEQIHVAIQNGRDNPATRDEVDQFFAHLWATYAVPLFSETQQKAADGASPSKGVSDA